MKKYNLTLKGIVVTFLLLVWSCEGYLEQFNMDNVSVDVELTPSFAAPLAYGAFSIQDILESLNDSMGIVSQTEDSLLFVYMDTSYTFIASDLLEIPNQIGTETYIQSDINVPEWLGIPIGTEYQFHKIEKMDFVIEPGDRIDSAVVKAGQLVLDAYSEFRHSGELTITSSNIIDPQGDTLDITFIISDTLGTFQNQESYDLTDYILTMDEVNDTAYILINFNLKLIKSSADIALGEEAGMEMNFTNLEYQSIFGSIARREVTDIEQVVPIGIFDNVDNIPDIYFEDPQLNIAVHNSIGIPIEIDIENIESRSAIDGSITVLEFKNDTMNPYIINAPSVAEIGQTVTTERHFNVETCNIDELISSVPNQMTFAIGAATGTDSIADEQYFVLDTSKMTVDAEVMLPIWFRTTGYTLVDTLNDIEITSLLEDLDIIERILFRLTTTNEWPLEISMQIYFVDDNYVRLGSLFEEKTNILNAAPITADGELDEGALVPYILEVEKNAADLESLKGATHLLLEATVRTSDDGLTSAKFYSKYLLDYKLAVSADFRINPAEL